MNVHHQEREERSELEFSSERKAKDGENVKREKKEVREGREESDGGLVCTSGHSFISFRTLLWMERHSSESPENRFVGSWICSDMAIEVNIISFLYRL